MIAAAFLVGSSGYEVAGRRDPAINLGVDEIRARLDPYLATMEATPIGLCEKEIRSGYSGALFVAGRTSLARERATRPMPPAGLIQARLRPRSSGTIPTNRKCALRVEERIGHAL
jgi:hypothetical protein